MTGRARKGHTAALLVRVVPTVVVIVTLPAAWHAAVVLTAELVRFTGALIWGGRHWGGQGPGGRQMQGLEWAGEDGSRQKVLGSGAQAVTLLLCGQDR